MLIIRLGDDVEGQWLAEMLSCLLGQFRYRHEEKEGTAPPFHEPSRGKWQLDRGNNFWLFEEGDGYKAIGRYPANVEKLNSFADKLRQMSEVESVTTDSW
jgi:hypothetical protein